jgi:hypothetical protein
VTAAAAGCLLPLLLPCPLTAPMAARLREEREGSDGVRLCPPPLLPVLLLLSLLAAAVGVAASASAAVPVPAAVAVADFGAVQVGRTGTECC